MAAGRRPFARPWLALGAVAGPVLFTLGWLVLGFISPGYTMWGTHVGPYPAIELQAWYVAIGWLAFRQAGDPGLGS